MHTGPGVERIRASGASAGQRSLFIPSQRRGDRQSQANPFT